MYAKTTDRRNRAGQTVRSETFMETYNGWQSKLTGRTYKTAVHVQRMLKRSASKVVKNDPNAVYVQIVNWEPKTIAGALVVKTLTQPESA